MSVLYFIPVFCANIWDCFLGDLTLWNIRVNGDCVYSLHSGDCGTGENGKRKACKNWYVLAYMWVYICMYGVCICTVYVYEIMYTFLNSTCGLAEELSDSKVPKKTATSACGNVSISRCMDVNFGKNNSCPIVQFHFSAT